MIGGLSSPSHSGLRHIQRRLEASAHNTANLTTAATTILRVAGREEPPGQGVTSQTSGRSEVRFRGDADGAASTGRRTAPFVDEAVEQISIEHQAGALRRVAQTQDDMLGILVNITA